MRKCGTSFVGSPRPFLAITENNEGKHRITIERLSGLERRSQELHLSDRGLEVAFIH